MEAVDRLFYLFLVNWDEEHPCDGYCTTSYTVDWIKQVYNSGKESQSKINSIVTVFQLHPMTEFSTAQRPRFGMFLLFFCVEI